MPGPQVWFDDLEVGATVTTLAKGPITTAHIVRWSASMENWHRLHYDWRYATEHDKLPDVLVNGSWKQHVLAQMLKDWAGPAGWTWRIAFQYRAMDIPGDVITAFGTVTGLAEADGLGFAELEVGLRNSRGLQSTEGSAVVALPKRGGRAVPYPFVPPSAYPSGKAA